MDRFQKAVALIDEFNRQDPRTELVDGRPVPVELAYSRRMTAWLERLEPDASEELRLAARAQHIGRWRIPRDERPRDRHGYKEWRTDLAKLHAETVAELMREAGYGAESIARVGALVVKKGLKTDPECQTLEDVICLVFLEHYFAEFAPQHPEEKVIFILRRTWIKMSERGRAAALDLPLPPDLGALVGKALEPE